ncbi:hypothetical protein AAD018_005780 [Aestuariibius insulae]|uniref:hypothetical protein n=1 Tax=Aestuariibius insulae TaxID=2058287 RepID=UPI00345EE3B4
MTSQQMEYELSDLLERIEESSDRTSLQPRLHRVIIEMDQKRMAVPIRARRLNASLRDEAIEAQFDNMPV